MFDDSTEGRDNAELEELLPGMYSYMLWDLGLWLKIEEFASKKNWEALLGLLDASERQTLIRLNCTKEIFPTLSKTISTNSYFLNSKNSSSLPKLEEDKNMLNDYREWLVRAKSSKSDRALDIVKIQTEVSLNLIKLFGRIRQEAKSGNQADIVAVAAMNSRSQLSALRWAANESTDSRKHKNIILNSAAYQRGIEHYQRRDNDEK